MIDELLGNEVRIGTFHSPGFSARELAKQRNEQLRIYGAFGAMIDELLGNEVRIGTFHSPGFPKRRASGDWMKSTAQ